MMRKVQCITIRESFIEQIEVDKFYNIDVEKLYSDSDGDWYVEVFKLTGERIGSLKLSHFRDADMLYYT